MKKITHFFALLVLLSFTKMNSQSSQHDPNPQSNLLTFTANSLSVKEVNAFETRAVQKVEEFYDFLSVITDKKIDLKMREQAKKQAAELFSDKTCTVYGVPVEKFLDSCLSGKLNPSTEIKEKKLSRFFSDNNAENDSYEGAVSFSTVADKTKRTSVINLQRKEKQFGKEIKVIWSVFICEIK
ncbi:MAG: hypothetical protein IAF38_19830 [Bacteroidia bacterium]|nr:hypothetical protein [Bacteroidia bacterium]